MIKDSFCKQQYDIVKRSRTFNERIEDVVSSERERERHKEKEREFG